MSTAAENVWDAKWTALAPNDAKGEEFLRSHGIQPDPSIVRFGSEAIHIPVHNKSGVICGIYTFKPGFPGSCQPTSVNGARGLGDGLTAIERPALLLVVSDPLDFLAARQALHGVAEVSVCAPGSSSSPDEMVRALRPVLDGATVLLGKDFRDPSDPTGGLAQAMIAAGADVYLLPLRRSLSDELLEAVRIDEEPLFRLKTLMNEALDAKPWDPEAMNAVEKARRILQKGRESFVGSVSTGFPGVDRLLGGGLLGGRLYVLAGPTGWGKTALVLAILREAARRGVPSVYYSYEVTEYEALVRLVAAECRIPFGKLILGTRSDEEQAAYDAAEDGFFTEGPARLIRVHKGSPGERAREIRREVESLAAARGRPPLVAVDYLQAAIPHAGETGLDGGGVRSGINEFLRVLRTEVAVSLNCPVVAVSSISRTAYLEDGKPFRPPSLKDLKESGDIEFIADAVITLWPTREDWERHEGIFMKSTDLVRPLGIHVLKGRLSGPGFTEITWNGPLGTFKEAKLEPEATAPPAKVSMRTSTSSKFGPDDLVRMIRENGKSDASADEFSISVDDARRLAESSGVNETQFSEILKQGRAVVRRGKRAGVPYLFVDAK